MVNAVAQCGWGVRNSQQEAAGAAEEYSTAPITQITSCQRVQCHLTNTLPQWKQVKYSEFQAGLRQLNVQLNRKMLSELAASEPFSFKALVDQVRFMRGGA